MVRRRVKKQLPEMGMSLLDIISCAVGAAIILAILFSVIKTPLPNPTSKQFIFVRYQASDANLKGKVGFEIIDPDSVKWSVFDNQGVIQAVQTLFTDNELATSIKLVYSDDGTESFLMIDEPRPGTWMVKPYMSGYMEGAKFSKNDNFIVETLSYNIWIRGAQTRDNAVNLEKTSFKVSTQQISGNEQYIVAEIN